MDSFNRNVALSEVVSKPGACALAVGFGSEVHVAMMHYSYEDTMERFYFSTDEGSKKCAIIRASGGACPASIAIGTSDDDNKFVQIWGECTILHEGDVSPLVVNRHVRRNPSAEEFRDDPATVYIRFSPSAGRLTDYSRDDYQISLSF